MIARVCSVVALGLLSVPVGAADLLSPFAGSELVGTYEADYARLYYLPSSDAAAEPAVVEGRLRSRIYAKPDDKSNFEVFRSYQNELEQGGFDLVTVIDDGRAQLPVRAINAKDKNDFTHRPFTLDDRAVGVGTKGLVGTQAEHYLAARKRIDATDVLIVVFTSRSGMYAIEQLETAAMEEGTVTLTLDALRDAMESEGRVALYGIHFDSGSATILPESAATLSTIVAYLTQNPGRDFYVVGHTDDEGTLDGNLALSEARARAVLEAIAAELPASRQRLTAHGVGPLSPVATNQAADGRRLNRRVELVSTLE